MTIASQTSRISYTGDGVTTAFSVPFYFAANADLIVILQDTAGNQTTQVLGTNYTLTGATVSSGGTCTFTIAPTTGYLVTVYRDPAVTQTTSYNNNDPFPAKSHELALDKLTTIAQRTRDLMTRSIRLSEGEATITTALAPIATRKNRLLGFDGNGALTYAVGPTYVASTATGVAIVDTRSTAAVTTFAVSINVIVTLGLSAVADGGGATYVRGTVSSPGAFLDGGGTQYWGSVTTGQGNVANFDSRATAAAAKIASGINIINTYGLASAGDGGGATYTRGIVSSPGAFLDGGGTQYWGVVTASNSGASPTPGGRITLTSGTPVMGSSVTAATTIYYAPFVGKTVPVITSGVVTTYPFTASANDAVGLSIVLGANWAANSIYDVFVALNGTTLTLATGPDWSAGAVAGSNTIGSSARGTGAGSTELQIASGLLTNKNTMTLRYANASTFSAAANAATYLGTARTGSAGQVSFTLGSNASTGGIANLFVWNAYNQVPVRTTVGDTTSSWSYTSATVRASNNSANNRVNFLTGLAVGSISASAMQTVRALNVIGASAVVGIALNSTTVFDIASQITATTTSTTTDGTAAPTKGYSPQLGANFISLNERGDGTNAATFFGNPSSQYHGLTVGLDM